MLYLLNNEADEDDDDADAANGDGDGCVNNVTGIFLVRKHIYANMSIWQTFYIFCYCFKICKHNTLQWIIAQLKPTNGFGKFVKVKRKKKTKRI